MTDPFTWSIRIGRWTSPTIRVHFVFLFFVAGKLLFTLRGGESAFLETLAWVGLLVLALALHELGHALAAVRLGRDPDDVLLWPLGNLSRPGSVGFSSSSSSDVVKIAVSGLATSGILAILAAFALKFTDARFIWYPFGNDVGGSGAPILASGKQAAAFSAAWAIGWFGYLNWVIFLLNLVPAPPLDAGRVVRTLTSSSLSLHPRDSLIAPLLARGCAIVMGLVAFVRIAWAGQTEQGVALILLAVLIELVVRYETRLFEEGEYLDSGVFGYDFSEGYTSLEGSMAKVRPRRESVLKRWRRRRSELRRERRQAREAAEELRMDEILAKLHREGAASLTDEETRFLRRVSLKIRNRSKTQG